MAGLRIAVEFGEGPLGMSFRTAAASGAIEVSRVAGQSEQLGVLAGDVIDRIDGAAMLGKAQPEILAAFRGAGRPLTVVLMRPGTKVAKRTSRGGRGRAGGRGAVKRASSARALLAKQLDVTSITAMPEREREAMVEEDREEGGEAGAIPAVDASVASKAVPAKQYVTQMARRRVSLGSGQPGRAVSPAALTGGAGNSAEMSNMTEASPVEMTDGGKAAQSVPFSGMLMKEGSSFPKTWKLRFCVLDGAGLQYFAKEGDRKAKGAFGGITGACDVPDDDKQLHRFDVFGAGTRVLRAAAMTATEKAMWVEKIGAPTGRI
jgi:hypothetical protein